MAAEDVADLQVPAHGFLITVRRPLRAACPARRLLTVTPRDRAQARRLLDLLMDGLTSRP